MNRTSQFPTLRLTLAGGNVANGIGRTWYTIDGGGDKFTAGGGQFGLAGGFWEAFDAASPVPPLADHRFDAEGVTTAIGHVIQVRPEPHPAPAWRLQQRIM